MSKKGDGNNVIENVIERRECNKLKCACYGKNAYQGSGR